MPHTWQLVKNSREGGHRPREDYLADISDALDEFEKSESDGFVLHPTVREFLGLHGGEQVVDNETMFVDPFPFAHSHDRYVCGLLATPTSVSDGRSEFTSLYFIATPGQLMTVILDPAASYAGPFGQRIINRRNAHLESGNDSVGQTLLMIIRDNVTSLNFALRELSDDVDHYSEALFNFGRGDRSGDFETLRMIETYLVMVQTEVESLRAIVVQTARLVEQISTDEVEVGNAALFDWHDELTALSLGMRSQQSASIHGRLEKRIVTLLTKCEQLRDKFFVEATHRIGAVAALLLVPTFIVGLYGQNFDFPEKNWGIGYGFSWILIVVSTVSLTVFFKRRKWL